MGAAMVPRRVNLPIVGNQCIHVVGLALGKEILEHVDQVTADVGAKKLVRHAGAPGTEQSRLNGAADIRRGVYQSAVNVEEIYGEIGNQENYLERTSLENEKRGGPWAIPLELI